MYCSIFYTEFRKGPAKFIMARSHCTRPEQVQGMGLAQWETMGLVPFLVLVQCEQFSLLLPVPIPFSVNVPLVMFREENVLNGVGFRERRNVC